MNFADIETFMMIVQTKSITKTAENLFLSQPTVSHRLKTLEAEVNMPLIIRKKGYKTVELTSKGEEFIPIADRWMSIWKEMQALQHSNENHYLIIGCIDTLSAAVLAPFYSLLYQIKPAINLRIQTHQSYEIYALLEKHEIDIGFVFHNLYFKNVISEPLIEEKLYIIQSLQPSVEKTKIHTDEMDLSKELYFNWDTNYQIWHNQWINHKNHPVLQVDTYQMIQHFMESDSSLWMIAPTSIIKYLLHYHGYYVSEIKNTPKPPKRVTYRIHHKDPHTSTVKAVDIFMNELTEYLSWNSFGEMEQLGAIEQLN